MATGDRVWAWRRSAPTRHSDLAPLLDAYRQRRPRARLETIIAAYELAADAHSEQSRSSGEKYINHPLAVARIVVDMGLDEESVVAALIHDVVEDTNVSLDEVERRFGADVAGTGLTSDQRKLLFPGPSGRDRATGWHPALCQHVEQFDDCEPLK